MWQTEAWPEKQQVPSRESPGSGAHRLLDMHTPEPLNHMTPERVQVQITQPFVCCL
jgi:hypothetical protein